MKIGEDIISIFVMKDLGLSLYEKHKSIYLLEIFKIIVKCYKF